MKRAEGKGLYLLVLTFTQFKCQEFDTIPRGPWERWNISMISYKIYKLPLYRYE